MKDRSRTARPRRRGGQEGAAAIEFAIVAGLLFMLVFGIIDFGFGFHTWNGTAHAAREGARFAAVDANTGRIIQRTRDASSFLDQDRMTVTVSCSVGGSVYGACNNVAEGDYIRVAVDYKYPFITPLPTMAGMGEDLDLHSESEVRFEGE